jgi:hypothetical protein
VSDQLDLFAATAGKVRHDAPATSLAAAEAVMPRTGTQRRRVLEYVASRREHGATDLELQQALALSGNSERPRRIELVEAGWLIESGLRRRGHIVWKVVQP